MINWPNSLIDDLVAGRCVVFLGSGVSNNSVNDAGKRPKTWRALLETANASVADVNKRKVIKKCIDRYDYLMACELVKKALGDNNFSDFLRDEFQTPGFHHAAIHDDIFKLDAPVVITPNFDKIYDNYASNASAGTVSVLNYFSADIIDNIRSGRLTVLKMHGTIDERSKLIFTKKDYAESRNTFVSFYKLMEALILTRTFLFLGAGLNDPDIQLLLENYCFQYGHSRKHYFVIHKNEYSADELDVFRSTMNLEFLQYEWSNRTKSHQDFLDSVRDLSIKVNSKRQLLMP